MSNFLKSLGESAKSGLSALPGGLITSAGSGLISGLIGNIFAKKRAALELKNQKELMNFQADKMLELTRNQAVANKEGLRAAGLSTAMMDGPFSLAAAPNGGASMPSSSISADIAGDYHSLASGGLANSQTDAQLIANQYSSNIFERQLAEYDSRISNIEQNTDAQHGDYLLKMENLRRLRATYEIYLKESAVNLDLLSKNLEKLGFEAITSEIQSKYAESDIGLRLQSIATHIGVLYSQKKLNEANAKQAFATIANIQADTESKRLSNDLFRDTYDSQVREIQANSDAAINKAIEYFYDKEQKRFHFLWQNGRDVPERVAAEKQAILDNLLLQPKLSEATITKIAAQTKLTRAQVKTEHAKMLNEYAQAAKNGTEAVDNLVGIVGGGVISLLK